MDYSEKLRQILNEINAADPSQQDNQAPATDDDDENDNFMDDAGGEDEGGDDTGADADTGDDESDNFMDDGGDEGGDDNNSPPADDDAGDDESDNFMDDSGDEGDNTPEDAGGDEGGDDTGGDTGDEESDNFMDDAGGGDEGGDDTSGGDDAGSGDEGEGSSEEGEQQGEDNGYDIEKIEDELFSSLTPEQIAIKNHELKNQFIEIYSIIGSTLVRINDVPKSNDNVNILKFITEKLLELRDMVDYNITTAYNTRTYIENNIIYQQCIATLNAIADIIDNIPNINGGQENTKSEDDDNEDKGEPVEQDDAGSEQLDISDTSVTNYQEESTNYNFLF
jgi:hypothetical protein